MTASALVVVLDASVAVKWVLLDEDHRAEALRFRRDAIRGRVALAVPPAWHTEVVHALLGAGRRGRVASADLNALLAFIEEVPVTTVWAAPSDVLRTAVRLHISAYDAAYVAIARNLGTVVQTGDRKLAVAAADPSVVRWIGSHP